MSAPPYPRVDGREPCRTGDPDRFHPEQDESNQSNVVKQECFGCHVREQCLAFALSTGMSGVWGGTTASERKHIRQHQQIPLRNPDRRRLDSEQVLRMAARGTHPRDIAELIGSSADSVYQALSRAARKVS